MGPQEREKGGVESLQEVSWPRGLLSPKGTCLSGGLALAGSLPRFSRDLGNPLTPRNATSSGETPASGVATVRSAGWSASGNLCFPRCVPRGGFPWAKRSLSYRKYHGRGQELACRRGPQLLHQMLFWGPCSRRPGGGPTQLRSGDGRSFGSMARVLGVAAAWGLWSRHQDGVSTDWGPGVT